jgi:hypothetical protein
MPELCNRRCLRSRGISHGIFDKNRRSRLPRLPALESLAKECPARGSRCRATHEPDQRREIATQSLQMAQIDLSQGINQQSRMRTW